MTPEERRRLALEALGVKEGTGRRKRRKVRPARSADAVVQPRDYRPDAKKRSYWSCEKKMRYKTQADATMRADRFFRLRGTRLRVYYCDNCHGYHLTKQFRKGGAK